MHQKIDNISEANHYNVAYLRPEYWHYRRWLYGPFIRAVVAKGRLSKGASVLDAGCGQGFFTGLLAELGFKALGVDLSAVGIASARANYGSTGAVFKVGDVLALPYSETFDCVFTRSFGPYTSNDFESNRIVTEALLEYVKPGGLFIFDYYTRLKRKMESPDWLLHSMGSVRKHFEIYPTARVYFSLRFDTILFGKMTFCAPIMSASCLVSKATGLGGEALALVRKPALMRGSLWQANLQSGVLPACRSLMYWRDLLTCNCSKISSSEAARCQSKAYAAANSSPSAPCRFINWCCFISMNNTCTSALKSNRCYGPHDL